MADAFLVSEATRTKLQELIRRNTGDGVANLGAGVMPDGVVQLLEVQSGSANTHGRPAFIQDVDDTGAVSDQDSTITVRVIDPNGGDFSSGQFVLARYVGISASTGEACFVAASNEIVTSTFSINSGSIAAAGATYTNTSAYTFPTPGEYLVIGNLYCELGAGSHENSIDIRVGFVNTAQTVFPLTHRLHDQNIGYGAVSARIFTVPFCSHVTVPGAADLSIVITNNSDTAIINASTFNCAVVKITSYGFSQVEAATIGTTPISGIAGLLYSDGTLLRSTNSGDVGVSGADTAILASGLAKIRAAVALRAF